MTIEVHDYYWGENCGGRGPNHPTYGGKGKWLFEIENFQVYVPCTRTRTCPIINITALTRNMRVINIVVCTAALIIIIIMYYNLTDRETRLVYPRNDICRATTTANCQIVRPISFWSRAISRFSLIFLFNQIFGHLLSVFTRA